MDFELTDKQRELRDVARRFARERIRPVALELDAHAEPELCFSWDLIRELDEVGLRVLNLPEQYGGRGVHDYVSACLVMEELAAEDIAVAGATLHNRKLVEYLMCDELATDDQRDRFLGPFAENPLGLAAGAITEPDAGTDNLLPFDQAGAGHQMTVVADGPDYVLNGVKQFISEGGAAAVYFVYARSDATVGVLDGTSVFIVPGDTPGLTLDEVHNKAGGRLSFNSRLRFTDCRIPRENLYGPWNKGLRAIKEHAGSYEFIINAARCVGLARACYEAALEHSRTRVQGGGPIFGHDLVADRLVESFVAIEAARTLIWRAAWAADHGEPDFVRLGKAAALFAQQMVIKVALVAQEVFGAYGIMRGSRIEKLVRDALTCMAFEGGQNPKKLQLQALL